MFLDIEEYTYIWWEFWITLIRIKFVCLFIWLLWLVGWLVGCFLNILGENKWKVSVIRSYISKLFSYLINYASEDLEDIEKKKYVHKQDLPLRRNRSNTTFYYFFFLCLLGISCVWTMSCTENEETPRGSFGEHLSLTTFITKPSAWCQISFEQNVHQPVSRWQ